MRSSCRHSKASLPSLIYLIVSMAVMFCAPILSAQIQLGNFTPTPKAIGIGGSGVVEISDVSALYWNPASLALLHQSQALFAVHEPFLINYAGYAHFFPARGAFALHFARTSSTPDAVQFAGIGWGSHLLGGLYGGVSVNGMQLLGENWITAGVGLLFRPSLHELTKHDGAFFRLFQSPLLSDRLTIGLCAQNLPLILPEHDHQVRVGMSYRFTPWDIKILFAEHFNRTQNTSHIGLAAPVRKNIQLYIGARDLNKNLAFGVNGTWENLGINLVYDTNSKRIAFSTSVRIGGNPILLAHNHFEAAKEMLFNRNRREAHQLLRKSLSYDPENRDIRQVYSSLNPIIQKENLLIDSLLISAKSFERKNWFISAAAQYSRVLRMDPKNANAQKAIVKLRPKVDIHTERWYKVGARAYEDNDLKHAKEIFESIILVRPDHISAKTLLQNIHEIYAKEAESHYYRGLGYYSQRNLTQSQIEFQKAVELVPNYQDAIKYLQRIIEERSRNARRNQTLLAEAQSFESQESWKNARDRYAEILQVDPYDSTARASLTALEKRIDIWIERIYLSGENAFKRADYSNARSQFRNIISLRPDHAGARRYLRLIAENTSDRSLKNLEIAREMYESGKFGNALSLLDSLLQSNANFSEAQVLRDRVISQMDVQQLMNKAKSDFLAGRYLEALENFNLILDKNPGNSEAQALREQSQTRLNDQVDEYFNRGLRFYTEERYTLAIAEWEKALRINPEHKGSQEYKRRALQRLEALNQLQ